MMLAMVHIGDSWWMKDFRGRVTLASSMSKSLVAGAEVVDVTGYALRPTFRKKKDLEQLKVFSSEELKRYNTTWLVR